MSEERVSGNIFAKPSKYHPEGETYVVNNDIGQGWQIPVQDITPDDLRALADRIEARRRDAEKGKTDIMEVVRKRIKAGQI